MTDQLEQEIAAAMRRQADKVPYDTDLEPGAFRKSRQLRLRRQAAAALVAAAALTIAVPTSLHVLNVGIGPTDPDLVMTAGPLETPKESRLPAQVGPVQLDFGKLPRGVTYLPWWDKKQGVIHHGARTTAVRSGVSWFTEVGQGQSYAVSLGPGEQGHTSLFLMDADNIKGLKTDIVGQIAISADGSRLAWTTGVDNSTNTAVTVASAESGRVIAAKQFDTAALRAGVGFAGDSVVLTNDLRAKPSEVWVWRPDTDQVTRPGMYVLATSPETGLISIVTDVKETSSGNGRLCSAVVDATHNRNIWHSCDLAAVAISPDGQYALAKPSVTTGLGVKSYTVIHLATGRKVAEFRADQLDSVRWEGDSRHFVVEAAVNDTYALVRCGTDGRCRLLTDPMPYQPPALPGTFKPYVISSR